MIRAMGCAYDYSMDTGILVVVIPVSIPLVPYDLGFHLFSSSDHGLPGLLPCNDGGCRPALSIAVGWSAQPTCALQR